MVTFDPALPDTANVGDSGHTSDHNSIVAALTALNAGKAEGTGELAGWFDVTNATYGAVGDDSNDDTAEIQACLDAGAGATVYFPPGTYKISDALTVAANTTITGTGTIHQTVSGKKGLDVNGSGVTIEGITLKGRNATADTYTAGEHAIDCTGTNTSTRYTDLTVRGVTIHLWGAYGVYVQYVTRFRVDGCHIYDVGYTGIGVLSGNEGIIQGNRVDNITPGSSGDMYGIALTHGGGNLAADPATSGVVVDSNVVSDIDWEGIETHGGTALVFSNNVILNCANAFAIVTAEPDRIPGNIAITGNTIDGMIDTEVAAGELRPLVISGNGTGPVYVVGVTFAGNTIRRAGYCEFFRTRGLVVTGNTFDRVSLYALLFTTTNENAVIANNTATDIWSDSDNNIGFIVTSGSSNTTASVHGNTLVRGAQTATYANCHGIRHFGTTATFTVGINNFWAATIAAYDPTTVIKTGFFAVAAGGPVVQPDVTGARDESEGALANLLTALESLGIITDSSTAS